MKRSRSKLSGSGSGTLLQVNLSVIQKAFELPMPAPDPAFTYSFSNLIPPIELDIKSITKHDSDTVRRKLHLSYPERFSILSSIDENKSQFLLSEANKQYSAAIICQSICSMYFYDCRVLDNETARLFLSHLAFVQQLIPNNAEIALQIFLIIFDRLVKSPHLLEFVPTINSILSKIRVYNQENINIHLKALTTLIGQWSKHPLHSISKIINTYISYVMPNFDVIEDPTLINDDDVMKFYDAARSIKSCDIWRRFEKINDSQSMHLNIVELCIQLEYYTEKEFTRFDGIVQTILSALPVVHTLPHNETMRYINDKSRLIDEVFSKGIPKNESVFKFPTIPVLSTSLESEFHPIYHLLTHFLNKKHCQLGLEKVINSFPETASFEYHVFTYLLILKSDIPAFEVVSILDPMKIRQIFFSKHLFDPSVTVFTADSTTLLSVRDLAISTFHHLCITTGNAALAEAYIDFFRSIPVFPHLASEFSFISQKLLGQLLDYDKNYEELIKVITRILQLQQNAFLEGIPNMFNARYVFLQLLSALMAKGKISQRSFSSSTSLSKIIISMEYEDSFYESATAVLASAIPSSLSMGPVESCEDNFKILVTAILQCSTDLRKYHKVCVRLLKALTSCLDNITSEYISYLFKSGFMNSFNPIIETASGADIACEILHLNAFTTQYCTTNDAADYAHMTESLSGVKFDRYLYDSIIKVLSGSKTFTGIENTNAIPLIDLIFQSEFIDDFLQSVWNLVQKSVPACLECFKAGIAHKALLYAEKATESSQIELCYLVFEQIAAHCADRKLLTIFMRSLRKRSLRTSPAFHSLLLLCSRAINEPKDILPFSRGTGCITLGGLPAPGIPGKLGISVDVRIGGFTSNDSFLTLFRISNGTFSIDFNLYKSQFIVTSKQYKEDIVMPLTFPENEWTNVYIILSSLTSITIYFDGKKKGQGDTKAESSLTGSPTNCYLFGCGGTTNVRGQFTECNIYFGQNIEHPSSDSIIKQFSTSNPDQNTIASYQGEIIKRVTPLLTIFSEANGMDYVVYSISQLDHPSEGSMDNSTFCMDYIDAIFGLLTASPHNIDRMIKIEGFAAMAYFLSTSKSLELTPLFWMKVCQIGHAITDLGLLEDFFVNLTLNYSIWRRVGIEIQNEVFLYWKTVAHSKPETTVRALPIVTIISAIKQLKDTGNLTHDNLGSLIDCLISVAIVRYDSSDVQMISELMEMFKDESKYELIILKVIDSIGIKNMGFYNAVGKCLVQSKWVAKISSNDIHKEIATKFAWSNDSLFAPLYINYMKIRSTMDEKENDKEVEEIVRSLLQREGTLEEIIKEKGGWIIQTDSIPYVFSLFFFCSPSTQSSLLKLFDILLRNPDTSLAMGANMKDFCALLLCIIAILNTQLMDALSHFAAASPEMFEGLHGFLEIISLTSHAFVYKQIAKFTEATIMNVFDGKFKFRQADFFNVFLDSICMHPGLIGHKIKAFDRDIFSMISNFAKADGAYGFSLMIDRDEWVDRDSALLLSDFALAQNISIERMVVPLSFMAHPSVGFAKRVAPSLDSLFERLPKELSVWAPVLVQMYRQKKGDRPRSDVLKFFDRKAKYESNLFELSTAAFENFVKTTKTPADRLNVLVKSINESMLIDNNESLIKDIEQTFDKLAEVHCAKLECSANNLMERVSSISIGNDFRRSNHFDYKFRPLLLTPTRHTEKTVLSTDEAVWKTEASLITLKGTIQGKLMISKNSVSFKGIGKSVQIPISSIKYIFQGPTANAVQLFTSNFKLRVFDLGMIKSSYFVVNMPEAFRPSFAQKKSSGEEIENLGLIKKWVSGKISTFDLVMWVNLLCGRCFHTLDNYPIFPNVISAAKKKFVISDYLSKMKPFSEHTKEPITSLQNLRSYLPPEYFFEPMAFEGVEIECSPAEQIRRNLESLESFDVIPWINKVFKEKITLPTSRTTFISSVSSISKFEKVQKSFPGKINCAFFESSQQKIPTVISDGVLRTENQIKLTNSEAIFAESKTTVAFASKDDPSPKLLMCKSGTVLKLTNSHQESMPILINASNRYVLTVSSDNTLSLYSSISGMLIQERSFSPHDTDITACAVSSTIGIAVSGSEDGQLIIYSIPKLRPLRVMSFDGTITHIQISSSGWILVATINKGKFTLTTITSNFKIVSNRDFTNRFESIRCDEMKGKDCAFVLHPGKLHVFDMLNLQELTTPIICPAGIHNISVNDTHKIVAWSDELVYTSDIIFV